MREQWKNPDPERTEEMQIRSQLCDYKAQEGVIIDMNI
jgi:hypothetical protein